MTFWELVAAIALGILAVPVVVFVIYLAISALIGLVRIGGSFFDLAERNKLDGTFFVGFIFVAAIIGFVVYSVFQG
jgi:hypothetical protein